MHRLFVPHHPLIRKFRGLDKETSLRSETISKFVIVSRYQKQFGRQCHIVVAIIMVNCLNVKNYILSIASENAVSVSQEVSDTKVHLQELLKSRFSISRDLNFMLSLSVRFNLTKTE
jgi:hypothetical protein